MREEYILAEKDLPLRRTDKTDRTLLWGKIYTMGELTKPTKPPLIKTHGGILSGERTDKTDRTSRMYIHGNVRDAYADSSR